MRIVCWNMAVQDQAGLQTAPQIVWLFNAWQADVVILLEPSSAFHRDQVVEPRGGGGGWAITCFNQERGSGQDQHQGRVSVAARVGVVAVQREGVCYPLGDAHYFRQLVVLRLTAGAEVLRVATCHAPFDKGSEVVVRYSNEADDAIAAWAAASARVDLWIADLNTAGVHAPHHGRHWTVLCARPTTARGTGNPRDKIFGHNNAVAGGGVLAGATAGRIIPTRGARDGSVPPDIAFPPWTAPEDVPSDHVPVYIQTAGVPAAAAAAAAAVAVAAAPAPGSLSSQFRDLVRQQGGKP